MKCQIFYKSEKKTKIPSLVAFQIILCFEGISSLDAVNLPSISNFSGFVMMKNNYCCSAVFIAKETKQLKGNEERVEHVARVSWRRTFFLTYAFMILIVRNKIFSYNLVHFSDEQRFLVSLTIQNFKARDFRGFFNNL